MMTKKYRSIELKRNGSSEVFKLNTRDLVDHYLASDARKESESEDYGPTGQIGTFFDFIEADEVRNIALL